MAGLTTLEGIENATPLLGFCRVVAEDFSQLCLLHDAEPDAELLDALRREGFSQGLGLRLVSEAGIESLAFFDRSLRDLPEVIDGKVLDQLAADFASIYLNYAIQASPEESVWLDEENLTCQQSMFEVRSCYARHGLGVEDWRKRPDDHLVLQLRFLQFLFERGAERATLQEAAQFMDEHLLRWLMQFARRVSARCDTAYFAGASMVTACYCEELRDLLATVLDEPRPTPEEIAERMKPHNRVEEVPLQYMPGIGPAV